MKTVYMKTIPIVTTVYVMLNFDTSFILWIFLVVIANIKIPTAKLSFSLILKPLSVIS